LSGEEPECDTADSEERDDSEKPTEALAESEESTLVDRGFDADIATCGIFDPPGGRLFAGESFGVEDELFRPEVCGGSQDG
jgi:hypothetical protein